MTGKCSGHRLLVLLPTGGAALDVSEEKGNRSGR
jgi:hypothetical protein